MLDTTIPSTTARARFGAIAAVMLLSAGMAHADGTRINQVRVLGSHNSYHAVPDASELAKWRGMKSGGYPNLEYGHPALTQQLDLGLHQFEIDIYADSKGGLFADTYAPGSVEAAIMSAPGLKVLHMWGIDQKANCLTLFICLTEIRTWSENHPDHPLMTIFINTHDIDAAHAKSAPEPMSASSLDELDKTARAVFGNALLTPDDVRGGGSSLREAVLTQGWPTVDATRGKIMMALDVGPLLSDVYRENHPSLRGRALFGFYPEADPEAAVFNIGDARTDGGRIRRLVQAGFIVRTRADADTVEARKHDHSRLEAALASGAQIISTDYYPGAPDPMSFGFSASIDGGFEGVDSLAPAGPK